MINCEEVNILFSRDPTDTTCFFNPHLENFYIQILAKDFPKVDTSTVLVDFFKAQSSASYENS
jgi:hypothetical protein